MKSLHRRAGLLQIVACSLAATALSACGGPFGAVSAPSSTLFAAPWNSGVDAAEPPFQTQEIDPNTFVIRQSIRTSLEAPFVYLLFGDDRVLLIDTGDKGADLRTEVDRLIQNRRAIDGRKSLPLVVMHSHSHGDHTAGDARFVERPDTTVVGHSVEDVAAFFGMENWPDQEAVFDLGGRVVEILPTPGHHDTHVMVFDRRTRILFSGDAVYPGILRFQCAKAPEYLASIERAMEFARIHDVRWLLGGHVEMQASSGRYFASGERVRRNEHLLEVSPSILADIQAALAPMVAKPVVQPHEEFLLFPHPADPRGLQPPNWCQPDSDG